MCGQRAGRNRRKINKFILLNKMPYIFGSSNTKQKDNT